MMRRFLLAGLVVLGLTWPSEARADLFLTPYAGVNFAGSTVDTRVNVGAALTWLGARGLGVEVDLGFIPDFFEPKGLEIDVLGGNHVTTAMANVLFARPRGLWRPYISVGGGLIRSQVAEFGDYFDATDNAVGVNAGAGLRVGGGRLGLRGDVRYFRNLTGVDDAVMDDVLGDFAFWRATAGLTIGF